MNQFWKHLGKCMIWLLLSEILCLVLAISLAILRQNLLIRVIGLICCTAAHILLIGSCAQKTADEDAADYRSGGARISPKKVLLIAICAAIPAEITYLLLLIHPESILMLNLFPLLNAPFLQIHRLLIDNTEPFSAIAAGRKVCMAIPPVITSVSWFAGYYLRYIPVLAKADANSNRT